MYVRKRKSGYAAAEAVAKIIKNNCLGDASYSENTAAHACFADRLPQVNSSSSTFASRRSPVSKPSVNLP
jgi:hypothetical protein